MPRNSEKFITTSGISGFNHPLLVYLLVLLQLLYPEWLKKDKILENVGKNLLEKKNKQKKSENKRQN